MRKNHQMIKPQNELICGIFPIFISYTTTHHILTYWKDHGGEELKRILFSPSPELKTQLQKKNFDLVIPIPQHLNRSLKRGHSSAFEVAKLFSHELNVPLNQGLFLRDLPAEKQANLNEWERRFSESPFYYQGAGAKRILIVDDFITTGSTLEKAANAILEIHPKSNIYAASLGWKPKIMN